MSLVRRLENTPSRRAGLPCSIGALLDRLDKAEADALNDMMGPLGWSASRIYDALVAEGHEVGRQTIGRHRSRACRCYTTAA